MTRRAPLRGASGFGLLALLALLVACSREPQASAGLALAPYDETRLGEVPDFRFLERSGREVSRAELAGRPWIASLFFSACAGPCPRLNGDIRRRLHDQLEGTGIPIVSFSVDPVRDDVPRLAEYADSFGADPERWLFLTGPEVEVHEFVTGALKLPVAVPPPPEGQSETENERLTRRLEITHSTRLVAVDAEGRIAGYYSGGGEGDAESSASAPAFDALLARVRVLAGLPPSESILPTVDAALNALASVLLIAGWIAIRRGHRKRHAALMRSAVVVSAAFLVVYLTYHATSIETRFRGSGTWRVLYLVMLASHVVLAVATLPLVLRTLWLAHRQDFERHRRWARVTLPIWLYVSVTGVLVYLALYHGGGGTTPKP